MKGIKKSLTIIFCLLCVFGFTKMVYSTSGNYTIKVKIVEQVVLGIQIIDAERDLGYVLRGTSITTRDLGSNAVKSTSTVVVDLKLKITGYPSGWSVGTTLDDAGTDKFVLATVFHEWNGLTVSTNPYACFQDDDVLTTEDKTAGTATGTGIFASEFVNLQATATPENADGYSLTPNQQVNNHFFFKAPTSLSDSNQYGQEQTITVTVTAVQH